MKVALLVIDPQNDFCLPTGSLYVSGAEKDMARLAAFVKKNKEKINHIALTQDSHHVIDISHPGFWQDKNGKNPNPFTIIKGEDVDAGVWSPRFYPIPAIEYIHKLEAQGEFPHCIWPEHCLMGTNGAAVVDELMDTIKEWCRLGHWYKIFTKGTYPLAEHFGAFRANVEIVDVPSTQLNQDIVKDLSEYDKILLSGEASSHCVANTLKQVMDYFPALAKKFSILEDCMSPVPGFEHIADKIYEDAKKMGIDFVKTTDVKF